MVGAYFEPVKHLEVGADGILYLSKFDKLVGRVAAGAVAGLVVAAGFLVKREPVNALFMLGAAILCAGLAILLFCACVWVTKAPVQLTKKMVLGMKALLMRKGS